MIRKPAPKLPTVDTFSQREGHNFKWKPQHNRYSEQVYVVDFIVEHRDGSVRPFTLQFPLHMNGRDEQKQGCREHIHLNRQENKFMPPAKEIHITHRTIEHHYARGIRFNTYPTV